MQLKAGNNDSRPKPRYTADNKSVDNHYLANNQDRKRQNTEKRTNEHHNITNA